MNKFVFVVFLFLLTRSVNAQSLYFPPISTNQWETMNPDLLNWNSANIDSLNQFLERNNTKAFILLKDGKIVLEKYFDDFDTNSIWYWASAGKTLTSFLIGIAQQEQYLSIYDTSSQYLGLGWTECSPEQERKITIKHQLTMTSGLDDDVPDPYCTIDTCLQYLENAGDRWAYHNAPYTLLDQIIENATGITLNQYMTQKVKNQTGISGLFVPSGYNNVYYSNARSMARFGLLILNKGKWDQTIVLSDTNYYNEMVNTSQNLNLSYGYLWWLNGKSSFMIPQSQFVFPGFLSPHAPEDMFAAMGKNGQFINVVPSENLVWIRLGDSPENTDVSFLLNDQIWEYINRLPDESGISERTMDDLPYPNPTNGMVHFSQIFKTIYVLDISGKRLQTYSNSNWIDLTELNQGIYIIQIINNKQIINLKIVKSS
ncbi:MAG: serine hydrolase [Bacteroidetes bacterium]|nr:serine hydrolase [Bacteroidota bacterium]